MHSDLPVVVFGAHVMASLTAYCLANDSGRQIAGFTVDAEYCQNHTYDDLPLVKFEDLEATFPPHAYELIIPLGPISINSLRRKRYMQAKQRGYRFASYISSRASVWRSSAIGENSLIFENAIIQPFATVGDNVIIRAGANIGHHGRVGDHTFIASGATFGGRVSVGEQVFVGLGAVIRDGISIADRTLVGAGAVLVASTESDGVYIGNPARRTTRSSMAATEP